MDSSFEINTTIHSLFVHVHLFHHCSSCRNLHIQRITPAVLYSRDEHDCHWPHINLAGVNMHLGDYLKINTSRSGIHLIVLALITFFIFYVSFGLTPSHYSEGLRFLGIDSPPLFGEARSVRSDEWLALTPMFQSAVLGNFSTFNQFSPYNESFKSFWALPIFDWSLIFKPQLWSFWLVPPDLAFSIYFAIFKVAFILGYTIILHRIGVDLSIAFIGSLCLLFSHFVQVWWTSNAPTL